MEIVQNPEEIILLALQFITGAKRLGISQREVADRLRSHGLVIDKNAVQRMESGERFIIDTELHAIAKVFGISINELLKETD